MKDPWTWATAWGWTVGVGRGLSGRVKKGRNQGKGNNRNNKIFKKQNDPVE